MKKVSLVLFIPLVLGFSLQSQAAEPLVTGISVAYIHSANGSKLAQWYADTLGIKPAFQSSDWTDFKFGSSTRFAVDQQHFPIALPQKQPVVISFAVKDIHKAVAEMSKKGVKFYLYEGEAIVDVGSSFFATFIDPDGNFSQLNQAKK